MDPLPPDPYAALGVPRDATLNAIKSSYRKLALRYHPDKAPDKADEFHKIQTAYEAIGEEDARLDYDAQYKLQQLKKEQQTGRWKGSSPGHGHAFDVRTTTAAFDVRGSPRPDFVYMARGPARYETSERRPPTSAPQSSPRPANMFRGDDTTDYFSRAAPSRKYEYDDGLRRSAAPRTTKPSPHEKEDKLRAEAKKEKLDGTSKLRTAERKKRDQARGYDRKAKAASAASVDSEDSESGDSTTEYVRRDRMQENIRFAHVRPKAKSGKKDSDDEYTKERTRQRAFEARESSVKDYIKRSRVDGAPIEKGSPPPPYVNSDAEERLRSARRDLQGEFEGRSTRPATVRKSSSKTEKKTSTAADSQPAKPSSRRTGSFRASPTPEEQPRRPPTLFSSNSTPPEVPLPTTASNSRRSRTTSDAYREEPRSNAPDLRRAETQPSPRSNRTREPPTVPIQPSGLRHAEKMNDDSGYSTSSPSEDSPQQPLPTSNPAPAAKYRYSSDEPDGRVRYETRRPPGQDRLTRSPSPITARGSAKERTRGPPPSRSASYATDFVRAGGSDPERERPTSARRGDLKREDTERRRSIPSSNSKDDLPSARREDSTSSRRPGLQSSDSRQGSSSRKTEQVRQASAPVSSRTGLGVDTRERDRDPRLWGEVPKSSSPIDLNDMVEEIKEMYPKQRDRDREARHTDERGERDRPSRRYFRDLAAEDSGYGGVPPASRRGSEDMTERRHSASGPAAAAAASGSGDTYKWKTEAERYISEMKKPASARRAETYAGA